MGRSTAALFGVACLAILLGVNGQGAQSMSYASSAGACPASVPPCVQAGYQYIYDANGNLAFVPNDTSNADACPDFYGYAVSTGSNTGAFTLYTGSFSTTLSGTYTATQITIGVPYNSGTCTQTFNRGAAGGNEAVLTYQSYTGGSTCAPGACLTSGFNAIINTNTGGLALLSADSNSTDACYAYFGAVTSGSTFSISNVIMPTQAGPTEQAYTGVTGTVSSSNGLVVSTPGGCTYTFQEAASSTSSLIKPAIGWISMAIAAVLL